MTASEDRGDPSQQRACSSCAFLHRAARQGDSECRRLPPTWRYRFYKPSDAPAAAFPQLQSCAEFPDVLLSDWCGAWRDRTDAEPARVRKRSSTSRSRAAPAETT